MPLLVYVWFTGRTKSEPVKGIFDLQRCLKMCNRQE
jgi:hypothetical protein